MAPIKIFPQVKTDFLTSMMGRLEAATSRLEDMVSNIGDPSASTDGIPSAPSEGMSAAEGMGQARSTVPPPHRHMEPLPPTIEAFDGIINGEVKTFVNMSEEIGGLVAEQVR